MSDAVTPRDRTSEGIAATHRSRSPACATGSTISQRKTGWRSSQRVGLRYELAAIAKRLDGKRATLFPQPGGHAMPVVSGLVSNRAWIADAMGVEPHACCSISSRRAQPDARGSR